jgi:hypothetical protein
MRTWPRHLGLYIVFACGAGWFAGALRAEDKSIDWLGNYGEALRQARQTQKPILVEFRCEA